MSPLDFFRTIWPKLHQEGPTDLEGLREWLSDVMVLCGVVGFPLGLIATFPVFWAQKQYGLMILDIVFWCLLLISVLKREGSYASRASLWLCFLYGLAAVFMFTLGPHYARPGWFMLCSVMAALFFGGKAGLISVGANSLLLFGVYFLADSGSPVWSQVHAEPFRNYVMYVVNLSMLSLVAASPVGYILNKLNQALTRERSVQAALEDKQARLEEALLALQEEMSERNRIESEKAKLERQLNQNQKMEALGTLAGGIAHDFNNILTIILGRAHLALKRTEGLEVNQDIEAIVRAGRRAGDLVRHILAFSRQSEQKRQPVNMGPLVKETLKMLRATLPANIEFRENISADAPLIPADPTQMHQILINLCSNASQAMGDAPGVLSVSLERLDSPGPKPDRVRLCVEDTGPGIEPEILEKIFEPYFTTKEVGQGTGLGLSIVHGIATNHGGTINVDSRPGRGTFFEIIFPGLEGAEPEKETEETSPEKGKGRILFVDDEEAILEISTQLFETLGYSVQTSLGPMEALEFVNNRSEELDLVITDYYMPQMNGLELAARIKAIRADLPIVLCTGHSRRFDDNRTDLVFGQVLNKPFLISQMAGVIKDALSGGRGREPEKNP